MNSNVSLSGAGGGAAADDDVKNKALAFSPINSHF